MKYLRLFFLTILLISCSNKGTVQGEKPLRLVFITTCVDEDFFKPVKRGMTDAATLMGVECTFTGTPGADAQAQAQMVLLALEQGVDGIALNIIDSLIFDDVVGLALSKGVPVVAFNGDDDKTPNPRLAAVSQNHLRGGRLFGEKIAESIPANSHVLATMHSAGIAALDDRLHGIREVLEPKGITFHVVVTSNIADKASVVIADALKVNPSIKAVLCTGLSDTEGAAMAIEKYFSDRNLIAAGFDLSPHIARYIRNGQLAFTIDQQPYMQGFYPVVQLTHYLRYGIMPCDNSIGAAFVTRNNVDQVEALIAKEFR